MAFATGQSRFLTVGNLRLEGLQGGWTQSCGGMEFALNFLRNNVGIDSPALLSSPFILISALRPAMADAAKKAGSGRAYIVNVSAMEGQFYRRWKTDKHPHTNMAKAALNMMTRTSAPDYVKDGIHMNAVDTGWVTDEDPAVHAARKAELGFSPPLDIIDGAARIVDPVFVGKLTGENVWGQFLKDYKPAPW